MIIHKVVERGTRKGSNYILAKYTEDLDVPFLRAHPELFPSYQPGRIIQAARNTIGILGFDTLEHAEDFQSCYWQLQDFGIIIDLELDPKHQLPQNTIKGGGACFRNIIAGDCYANAPKGTIFCSKVKVLT